MNSIEFKALSFLQRYLAYREFLSVYSSNFNGFLATLFFSLKRKKKPDNLLLYLAMEANKSAGNGVEGKIK